MKNRIQDFLPAAWRRQDIRLPQGLPDVRQWAKAAEKFVGEHPGASLAVAFAVGVALAWWIKRK